MLILLLCGDRSLVLDVANYFDLRAQAEALFQPLIDAGNELDLSYIFPAQAAREKGGLSIPTGGLNLSGGGAGSSSLLLNNSTLSVGRGGADASRLGDLNTSQASGDGYGNSFINRSAASPHAMQQDYSNNTSGDFIAYVRCPQSFNTFLGVWEACIQPTLIESHQQLLPTLEVAQGPRLVVPSPSRGGSSSNNGGSNANSPSRGGGGSVGYIAPAMASGAAGVIYEDATPSSAGSASTRNKSARQPSSMGQNYSSSYVDGGDGEVIGVSVDREAVMRRNRPVISSVLSPSKSSDESGIVAAPSPSRNRAPPATRRATDDDASYASGSALVIATNSYTLYNGIGPDGLTDNQRRAKQLLTSFEARNVMAAQNKSLHEMSTIRAVMRCGEASVLVPFNPRRPPTQKQLLADVRESMLQKLRETERELHARSPSRARGNNTNNLTQDEVFEMAALEALSVPDPSAVVFVLGMCLPGAEHNVTDVDDDSDVRLLCEAMLATGNDYAVHLVVESRDAQDQEALSLPNAFFFGEVLPMHHHGALGFNRTQASPSRAESRNVSRPESRME